jgi:antitoxin component YwqK of YwqJK toxin-antitoxin module
MFKFFSLLLSICTSFASLAQEDTLNQTINGQKEGSWILLGKDNPDMKRCPSCKIEEGNYRNNRKQGVWKFYHADGETLKKEITYLNGRPSGTYKLYYENGNLKELGTWTNRRYRGNFKQYYESGCLQVEKYFNEDGKQEGIGAYYFDCKDSVASSTGQIEFQYSMKNGVVIDSARRYYENGDLKEIVYYQDGEISSSKQFARTKPYVGLDPGDPRPKPPIYPPRTPSGCERYTKNNELSFDGECRNGRIWEGKRYIYDENGLLFKVEVWKEGKYFADAPLEF